jgi:hypothetical protein
MERIRDGQGRFGLQGLPDLWGIVQIMDKCLP